MIKAANRDPITLSDNVIDFHIDAFKGLASLYQIVTKFAGASCSKITSSEVFTGGSKELLDSL